MKKLFTILFSLVSVFSYSQSFNGVNISGNVESTIQQLKAKGYKYVKMLDNVGYQLEETLANEQVELYVYFTPYTKQTAKFVIYFPEGSSYIGLLEGYELQAIKNEKGFVSSYWLNINNCSMSLSISKYAQLKITYENDQNMSKLEEENKKKNLIAF